MSGIIDTNGQQWEHCYCCGKFIKIQSLGYEKPTTANPHGRDLCVDCVDVGIQTRVILFKNIVPACTWKRTR